MGTPRGRGGENAACHTGCPDPAPLHLLGPAPPGTISRGPAPGEGHPGLRAAGVCQVPASGPAAPPAPRLCRHLR